jgi:transcriptional antiterminator Rof (Rho-off)
MKKQSICEYCSKVFESDNSDNYEVDCLEHELTHLNLKDGFKLNLTEALSKLNKKYNNIYEILKIEQTLETYDEDDEWHYDYYGNYDPSIVYKFTIVNKVINHTITCFINIIDCNQNKTKLIPSTTDIIEKIEKNFVKVNNDYNWIFNLEDFYQKEVLVVCKDNDDAIKFLNILDENNVICLNNNLTDEEKLKQSYTHNDHKYSLRYKFYENKLGFVYKSGEYSEVCHTLYDLTQIDFSSFIENQMNINTISSLLTKSQFLNKYSNSSIFDLTDVKFKTIKLLDIMSSSSTMAVQINSYDDINEFFNLMTNNGYICEGEEIFLNQKGDFPKFIYMSDYTTLRLVNKNCLDFEKLSHGKDYSIISLEDIEF